MSNTLLAPVIVYNPDDKNVSLSIGNNSHSAVFGIEYKISNANGTDTNWRFYNYENIYTYLVAGDNIITACVIDSLWNESPVTTKTITITAAVPAAPIITIDDNYQVTITPGVKTSTNSDVYEIMYLLWGAKATACAQYTGPFTLTKAGTTYIRTWAVDASGNRSTIIEQSVNIAGPVTPIININGEPNPLSRWTNAASVSVNITTTSGTIQYCFRQQDDPEFNVHNWVNYTGEFSVTNEGTTAIAARTIDKNQNTSYIVYEYVLIDRTGPTSPQISCPSSWSKNSAVPVFITAGTDNLSGVNQSQYYLSGATNQGWTYYSDMFCITNEGITNIWAVTFDNAGNYTMSQASSVKIDRTGATAPQISCNSNWTNDASIPVTITGGTDNLSGVQYTEYTLSGATNQGWTTYSQPFNITNEGITTIEATTLDNAEGYSQHAIKTVKIDKTGPTKPEVTIKNNTIIIDGSTDNLSGVNCYLYALEYGMNQDWATYTGPIPITSSQRIDIYAISCDNVFNSSQTIKKVINTTTDVPTIVFDNNQNTSNSSVSFTITQPSNYGIQYKLSGASSTSGWVDYTSGKITIVNNGITTVQARLTCVTDGVFVILEEITNTITINKTNSPSSFNISSPNSPKPISLDPVQPKVSD